MAADPRRALHWFRNDLRLDDNRALAAAARGAEALACVFVLDPRLAGGAAARTPRVAFLLGCLARLGADLAARGQRLVVVRGDPAAVLPRLARAHGIGRVVFARDASPFARRRDAAVRRALETDGVRVDEHKDRVVFESDEIRTKQGGPFQVFTPYRNAWWARFEADPPEGPERLRLPPPLSIESEDLPERATHDCDVAADALPAPGEAAARRRLARFLDGAIARYAADRDRPDLDGTSRLSPYLRFGVISVRRCFAAARECARAAPPARAGIAKWLDELVWREFYQAVLAEHPHVLTRSFKPDFDRVRWEDDDAGFAAWCEGRTGYPFVDAAMRQLAETGWMHNRARMVVASFLTKDLLIDWRRGERFFWARLVDGEPASNNGGWQWAASTGTDAQPYFRIFHPVSQGERFDPQGRYVRRYVPELAGVPDRFLQRPWESPAPPRDYPRPIVDHAERRALALDRFEAARSGRDAPHARSRQQRLF